MIESKRMIEALRDLGLPTFAYSGRGMYDRYCVATKTTDDFSEFGIGCALGGWATEHDSAAENIPDPHIDSLGRRTVLYWRGLAWPADMPHSEDGE